MMETHPEFFSGLDESTVVLSVGNRMVIENNFGDSKEVVSIRGTDVGLEEAFTALRKGALVTEMNIGCSIGDLQWQLSLKGESLNVSSLKTPETAATENRQDLEGAILEKIFLIQKIWNLLETVYAMFVRLRVSDDWQNATVAELKEWIRKTGPVHP